MSIEKVSILGRESTHIGTDMADYIANTVVSTLPSSTYALITDYSLERLYKDRFDAAFSKALDGKSSRWITKAIAPGESSKSRETKAALEDWLLKERCTRDTVILALGGGVIGDLVGFVAATFMRGVRVCQIPTTVLAMVDSSVGGKTAIDTPLGKNLIGAFHQPEYIFMDVDVLKTLPEREILNGLSEVVKTAAIWNESEFTRLEECAGKIRAFAAEKGEKRVVTPELAQILRATIKGSVAVKAEIVTIDEKETGLRNLVNFGHTIGHAIEALVTPHVLHGECVAIGMVLEGEVARALGILSHASLTRLTRCIAAYGLPTTVKALDPYVPGVDLPVAQLMDIMRVDKKNAGLTKKVVLLSRIGKTYEEKASAVQDSLLESILSRNVIVSGHDVSQKNEPTQCRVPGSKSISNRALVLAALSGNSCKVTNLLHSDDTQVMIQALSDMNAAAFEWKDDGDTLIVHGGGGRVDAPAHELYVKNAGTASRFLTSVAALTANPISLTGNQRMQQRPIGPLVDALRENTVDIDYVKNTGCFPIRVKSRAKGGHIKLAASLSSQYVSSILMCAPYFDEPVTLELEGGISQPYIDMTVTMMSHFGLSISKSVAPNGNVVYNIPLGKYTAPESYLVEGDASSATYPLAFAAVTGSPVTVTNVGSVSLQGDAAFAKNVLEPMGCSVEQTSSTTTVSRAKPLMGLGSIDMESMTDAFLTAAVLFALAESDTSITGIANQRVKECNRIKAMVDELAKFGVVASELEDGITISPSKSSLHIPLEPIDTYDDHRVAMSLSLLAVALKGNTCLLDKRCVEKTWPAWWDQLTSLGAKLQGDDTVPHSPIAPKHTTPSMILIGMRGSGKTTVASLAARALGWTAVDVDEYIQREAGDVRDYVAAHGWPAFREKERSAVRKLLADFPERHILSMGGGVVESDVNVKVLKESGLPIVHIVRQTENLLAFLENDPTRPSLGEPHKDIFSRRKPLYESLSHFEFFNDVQSRACDTAAHVSCFFNRLVYGIANLVQPSPTFMLSLTIPDLTAVDAAFLERATFGAHAVELRTDLLDACVVDSNGSITFATQQAIAHQLARLRSLTPLPVVFTLRTRAQGGRFPDDAPLAYEYLIGKAATWAVDYIDVEVDPKNPGARAGLVTKLNALKIGTIASYHDWSGNLDWAAHANAIYTALRSTNAAVIKIVGFAGTLADNWALLSFASSKPPGLFINMGPLGQITRAFNRVLTPVTSSAFSTPAAPGQLTISQINSLLADVGATSSREFYLFGSPVKYSKSPLIHNTAFATLGLPHKYTPFEATSRSAIEDLIHAPAFGGASVTIPLKETLLDLPLSEDARIIGAVNTLYPTENGIAADNTDWRAIHSLIKSKAPKTDTAIVLGAGGTARAALYALYKLGVHQILLYNRTHSKATALSDALPFPITVLPSLDGIKPDIVVSTIVPDGTASSAVANASAGVYIPDSLLDAHPVALDAAYRPKSTPLLALAQSHGCPVIYGEDMLLEQAYHQFRIWTGFPAPKSAILDAVSRA